MLRRPEGFVHVSPCMLAELHILYTIPRERSVLRIMAIEVSIKLSISVNMGTLQ